MSIASISISLVQRILLVAFSLSTLEIAYGQCPRPCIADPISASGGSVPPGVSSPSSG